MSEIANVVSVVDIEKIVGKYSQRNLLEKVLYRSGILQIIVEILILKEYYHKKFNVIIYDTYCPLILIRLINVLNVYLTVDSVKSPGIEVFFKINKRKFDLIFTPKPWEYKYIKDYSECDVKVYIQPSERMYDANSLPFYGRKYDVSFLGHKTESRHEIILACVRRSPNLTFLVTGPRWAASDFREFENVKLITEGVYGNEYFEALLDSKISLGFLNDQVGDRITTRSIEVPACGAVLLTLRTASQVRVLGPEGAIFVDDYLDFPAAVSDYARLEKLLDYAMISNGRIRKYGLTIDKFMRMVCRRIDLISQKNEKK